MYGFVQQSGGTVAVDSEPGLGTTFTIHLPAVDKEPDQVPAIPEIAAPGRGETILLAEDDDALRKLVKTTLEELGYNVLVASNGVEALEVEVDHEGRLDLLLSDVVMPGLGGFELSGAVKETRPDIKVIMMSGYSEDQIDMTALSEAGVPLLRKPFRPQELASVIEEVLGSGSKQGA